jgi:hypothetical protein
MIIKRNACEVWRVHELPSPAALLANRLASWGSETNHFERIELFFDLLSEDRSQAIACSNVSSSVVFRAGPRVVELYTSIKRNISVAVWCGW